MSALSDSRPRLCPAELLQPGDVIEVYVCIENDDWDWETREVLSVRELSGPGEDPRGGTEVHYRAPYDGGYTYTRKYLPGKTERLAFVDMPLLWEGDDS